MKLVDTLIELALVSQQSSLFHETSGYFYRASISLRSLLSSMKLVVTFIELALVSQQSSHFYETSGYIYRASINISAVFSLL